MKAVPVPDPRVPSGDVALQGEVPNPASPPSGCYFHPRCPFVVDVCRTESRRSSALVASGHLARCHRADELTLEGIGPVDSPARAGVP